jgi:flavin-dependent dehydrogenase
MVELTVFGGGPSGAIAARLLASWGHAVRLNARPAGDNRLAVSLPPSCAKLFAAAGVTDAVDRAGFIRSTGNTVWWGGDEPRVETFASGERGWQVEHGRLSDVLLACATAAGVVVERTTTQDPGEARFLLDCSGRAGVIARSKDLRQYHDGPTTIAVVGEWQTARAWRVPDDTHTVVESYRDGWMWSVPTRAGHRHVAAMVDPQRSDLTRTGSSREVYLGEIAKTRQFARLLADATLAGGPWGWDASTYGARQYAGDGWILVGDAGSFIDPLSSAGVKKALASAWLAAVVVHTCLVDPSMQPHALALYDARERELEGHHVEQSRLFLARAAPAHPRGFWTDRSADASADASGGAGRASAVRDAFERLKAASSVTLRQSRSVTIEARPYVHGHRVVLGPHLVPAGSAAGVRHLHGVDLMAVLELLPGVSQVPELFNAYVEKMGRVDLHDFLLALSTAVAEGWVVSEWAADGAEARAADDADQYH